MQFSLRVLHSLWYAAIIFGVFAGCSGNASNPEVELNQPAEEFQSSYDIKTDSLIRYSGDTQPRMSIRFERAGLLDISSNPEISRIGSIAIDDEDNVYGADVDNFSIHIFDNQGTYLQQIGREGRGPGEYIAPPQPVVLSNYLYLYDSMQFRVTAFRLDSLSVAFTNYLSPKKTSSIQELEGYYAGGVRFRKDGKYLIRFREPTFSDPSLSRFNADKLVDKYYLVEENGDIIPKKILELKGKQYITYSGICGQFNGGNTQERILAAPYLGKSLIAFSEEGEIFSAWSEDFKIQVHDSNGDYSHSFEYPFQRKRLNREEVVNGIQYEILKCVFGKIDLPDYWPVLNSMFVDDEGRLWASVIIDNNKQYEWWILDRTGALIATFRWPHNKPIKAIKNDILYTSISNEEIGETNIVKYKIEFTER